VQCDCSGPLEEGRFRRSRIIRARNYGQVNWKIRPVVGPWLKVYLNGVHPILSTRRFSYRPFITPSDLDPVMSVPVIGAYTVAITVFESIIWKTKSTLCSQMCVMEIVQEEYLDLGHIGQHIALIAIPTLAWLGIHVVEVLVVRPLVGRALR